MGFFKFLILTPNCYRSSIPVLELKLISNSSYRLESTPIYDLLVEGMGYRYYVNEALAVQIGYMYIYPGSCVLKSEFVCRRAVGTYKHTHIH